MATTIPKASWNSEKRLHRVQFPWQRERLLNQLVAIATSMEPGCLRTQGGSPKDAPSLSKSDAPHTASCPHLAPRFHPIARRVGSRS